MQASKLDADFVAETVHPQVRRHDYDLVPKSSWFKTCPACLTVATPCLEDTVSLLTHRPILLPTLLRAMTLMLFLLRKPP